MKSVAEIAQELAEMLKSLLAQGLSEREAIAEIARQRGFALVPAEPLAGDGEDEEYYDSSEEYYNSSECVFVDEDDSE